MVLRAGFHFLDYMNINPPIILCLGLPGSASTWVFNVCAQLVSLSQRSVKRGYADNLPDLLNTVKPSNERVDTYVIKSHLAGQEFSDYLSANDSFYVLTVRDPRDCVVSLMELFGFSFDYALNQLMCSCDSLMKFQSLGGILLRYEDRFFQSRRTIPMLCQYLGLEAEVDFTSLEHLNSQESIMEFINSFDELPDGRILKVNDDDDDSFDVVTHWHRHHFGDGLTGKWNTRLSKTQKVVINQMLAYPLKRLGYEILDDSKVPVHSQFASSPELIRN